MSASKQITVIGAGGTIAMEGAHPFDWVDYGDTGIVHDAAGVIAGMDFALDGIEVTPHAFRALPSTGITPVDWLALRAEILTLCAAATPPDGIVVTHGTATLEETAFFLHATLAASCPVLLAGAQRPPNTVASDALPGLRAAVAAATQLPAGVYLTMNGEIFDPVQVTKTANHALDAFEAPGAGPIGEVSATGALRLRRAPLAPKHVFSPDPDPARLPRVDISYSYAGADGTAIEAFVAVGTQGIVSIGLPPGRGTAGERQAMERAAAAGVCVVQASRALRGTVPAQVWNMKSGILSGGGLTPAKIRILVMLALDEGMSLSQIQAHLLNWTELSE